MCDLLLKPGRSISAGWFQAGQLVVEDRLKRFPAAIEQFHLKRGPAIAATPFEPEGVLTISQEAVAIQADANSPLRVTISEVLKRRVPEQPVDQQRLMIDLVCDRIGYQPWLIGLGL